MRYWAIDPGNKTIESACLEAIRLHEWEQVMMNVS